MVPRLCSGEKRAMAGRFDPAIDIQEMLERASNEMEKLFYGHEGNLINKWHHYLEIYDRYLSRFRGQPVTLIEVGVSQGGSLQLWKNYLGDSARVVGIDVHPRCEALRAEGLDVRIGSQTDSNFIGGLI